MKIAEQLNRLPRRAQRVLALLLVPATLVSIWAGVIWPIQHAYQSQLQWRAAAVQLLAQRRGVAEIESAVRAQLDALPNFQSWQKLYRTAAGSSAVVALQTDVNAALVAARARPQSFTPLEVAQVGALRKVGLRIVAPMTIDQLKEGLLGINALTRLVQIERLIITAPITQAAKENPTLIVTADVVGYAVETDTVAGASGE